MVVKDQKSIELYSAYLKTVASLSKLFSASEVPFLYYKVVENIFCKSFKAENLSRDDSAYDAKMDRVALGIKTFISNRKSSQKVAEFNTHSKELKNLRNEELVARIASLRNERIDFANRIYGVDRAYYHCVIRQKNMLKIFQEPYKPIKVDKITNLRSSDASMFFRDDENEYNFNFSKSTLLKKFYTPENTLDIDVEIIEDPLDLLVEIAYKQSEAEEILLETFVMLPLYSTRNKSSKIVPEKSGLNQWNAGGRKRDYGEVYIPIPQEINRRYPEFFPDRDVSFNLIIPRGQALSAKVCQDDNKALMTNPNNALSEWLLRDVLELRAGELLTYEKLLLLGIDSVRITKVNKGNYKINFSKIGSYEKFIKKGVKRS